MMYIHIKEIRSILEFGVPVWNGGISLHDSDRIEIIQRRAFKIILQDQYHSYDNACVVLNTQSLKERRIKICLTFAKKELSKEDSIFSKFVQTRVTRFSEKQLVNEIFCNTERHYRSSLPYLSRLINSTNKDTHTQIHWSTNMHVQEFIHHAKSWTCCLLVDTCVPIYIYIYIFHADTYCVNNENNSKLPDICWCRYRNMVVSCCSLSPIIIEIKPGKIK